MVCVLVAGRTTVSAQAIPSGSTVMIVQTPNDTPDLHYYIFSNSDAGTADIPFPIGEKGDVFDLYVQGTAWDTKIYLADTKVVNAYSPGGSFFLTSEDPWVVGDTTTGNYIKRTRADRPYRINLSVSGLSADPAAPQSASSVRLDRVGVNYDPATYSVLGATPYTQGTYSLAWNGVYTGSMNNLLTPIGSTKACGEERWQLNRWADINAVDGTETVPETIINNVTVQVWPVADVTLDGIVDGQVILDSIPSLSVQLEDVYPDSYTYCQIYKGTAALGTVGTKVAGSEIYYGEYYTNKYNEEHGITDAPPYDEATTQPQNPDRFFIDLNANCATDGTYTLEVISETPFYGRTPERLKYITFVVDRKTFVRGTISSGN